ncbi:Tetraketide alpha-pyrone reductase 1 [Morella rubra]|uniref:Tetraketide alpha-pyrone reductase 1 n=1 Tax=Morella rubra TaxID=262757 RepID=A0A6A1VAX4_9ROSI|nr:Tetraketide alpha-pyrone reductase 1 [Morella rubra]
MTQRRRNTYLRWMELRKDFICSKQTYWKKDLLILGLMAMKAFFIQQVLLISMSRIHGTYIPQAEVLDPAVKGTLNILRSCSKASSVKRVVITSSVAAVLFSGKPLTPDVESDETSFSDPAFCEKSELWYMLSKTLAEAAAWKFSKENGIDMVTINPGWVIGPLLNRAQKTLDPAVPIWVDVRDTATAHILAYENPSANGRYCVVHQISPFSEVLQILRELFPTFNLPETCEGLSIYKISKEKVERLGLKFIPFEGQSKGRC